MSIVPGSSQPWIIFNTNFKPIYGSGWSQSGRNLLLKMIVNFIEQQL